MARGTSLLRLVQMVREECGRSSSVGVGVDDLPGLKTKIKRAQEVLYDSFDWPHLRQFFDREQLSAGERYYDPSDGLNFDRIEKAVVWYSGISHPLCRGITPDDYNSYDSENDARSEPALKWDVRWTGTREQIEIWPIPSTNDQQLQFQGIRNLRPLVNDTDVADIDDQLIVLTVAAEILTGKKDPSASALTSAFQKRYATVTNNAHTNFKRYLMGRGHNGRAHQRLVRVTVRA